MKKNDFFFLLLGVSFSAFKYAEQLVLDDLKPEFRFNVYLNMSNDDENDTRFNIYREDNDKIFIELTTDEVVDLLCRNEKIPVWIDISVCSTKANITILQLVCAGRYSGDSNEFYYQDKGSSVFGIKSPRLPSDYTSGVKFRLQPIDNRFS